MLECMEILCRALQHNGSQPAQTAQKKQPQAKKPLNSVKYFYSSETFNLFTGIPNVSIFVNKFAVEETARLRQ